MVNVFPSFQRDTHKSTTRSACCLPRKARSTVSRVPGDGVIDKDELLSVFTDLGLQIGEKELKSMFASAETWQSTPRKHRNDRIVLS